MKKCNIDIFKNNIYTYMHTYIHTYFFYIHTYINTYIHTYIHTYDDDVLSFLCFCMNAIIDSHTFNQNCNTPYCNQHCMSWLEPQDSNLSFQMSHFIILRFEMLKY